MNLKLRTELDENLMIEYTAVELTTSMSTRRSGERQQKAEFSPKAEKWEKPHSLTSAVS